MRVRLFYTVVFLVCAAVGVLLAQPLPTTVLQLLSRNNTWTGMQTFLDFRLDPLLPADTNNRLYTDGTNLYWESATIVGAGGTTTPHNLLSSTHPDTLAASPPIRGDLVVANSTPVWARFSIGAAGTVLRSTGTDPAWSTDGSALTALNATQLTSGTVPLARISGLTNTEVDGAAAIAWTKISKTGSSLADLTTRSAADLSSGTLPDARLSSNVSLFGASVSTSEIDTGAITSTKVADFGCSAGQAMTWQLTGWTCGTFGTGSGSVTSVALAAPAFLTVSGSPITTSGTLTLSLATQTANTVFAGPTGGAPASPTFRALVNADFPLTGVGAGTYTKVTVNTAGFVTAGLTDIDLATDVAATVLPFANGGTGLSAASDDTVPVSTGSAWTATTVSNCTTTPLGYTQATNLFGCLTTLSGMTAITSTTLTGTTVNASSSLVVGSGSSVTKIVTGTTTYDPGSITDQTSVTTTLTVTGAAVGQVCMAALSTIDSENLAVSAFPSGADTVRVVIVNVSGGNLSPGSGTLRATCMAH
jgi:hypothetical protein